MKTPRLQLTAVENLLTAVREMPFVVCTWCGQRTMEPVKAFAQDDGWALLFHCSLCSGEHLEHAGMWPPCSASVRTDRTHHADQPSGGSGEV